MTEHLSQDEVKRAAKSERKTMLEGKFLEAWRTFAVDLGLPMPARQYTFCPGRKWRFDFSWIDVKIAVEIQGGSFMSGKGGGHNRGAQQAKDYEKHNTAVRLGWRVLFFNTAQMADPQDVVETVIEVMTDAKPVNHA